MKYNIQLEIDHEYDKKEKIKRQMVKHNKCECTKKKEIQKQDDLKDKIENEKNVKRQMELITEEKMMKLRNKQKELEERDKKRKIKLELFKQNTSKNLNETYALKKERVNKIVKNFETLFHL